MTLDDVRKLQQKKYREALGHYLVEGEHLVLELERAAHEQPALRGATLYVSEPHRDRASPFHTIVLSERQMTTISDTRSPQGVVAVVPILAPPDATSGERAIYLYEVQDPGNLGTILRTLAWFGGFRCLIGPDSVDPYNPKTVRASLGALFHVAVETDVPLDTLKLRYPRIACLDLRDTHLPAPGFNDYDCYLFGNEARGLPREALAALNAASYTVRGRGAIESLNLAAVVNMCVYEVSR